MDGILCLDKPQDMTSFSCCSVIRRLSGEKKTGHAGTLDPQATGVLPILLGRATKALDLLPVHDKRYIAEVQFGLTSDTLDIWGAVTETGAAHPSLSAVEAALIPFRGNILQVPPMMSALKVEGRRLYDLAREGIEIERQARPITVYALTLLSYDEATGRMTLDCHCSKGTYIRTLCDDLGRLLGCGAVMAGLRRVMAAGWDISSALTLEQVRQYAEEGTLTRYVLPVESAFAVYPAVSITAPQAVRLTNGGALSLERVRAAVPTDTPVRVYDPDAHFLGIAPAVGEELVPIKCFV